MNVSVSALYVCVFFSSVFCWGVHEGKKKLFSLCFTLLQLKAILTSLLCDLCGALSCATKLKRFNVTAWHAICNKHSFVVSTSSEIIIYNRITCTFT